MKVGVEDATSSASVTIRVRAHTTIASLKQQVRSGPRASAPTPGAARWEPPAQQEGKTPPRGSHLFKPMGAGLSHPLFSHCGALHRFSWLAAACQRGVSPCQAVKRGEKLPGGSGGRGLTSELLHLPRSSGITGSTPWFSAGSSGSACAWTSGPFPPTASAGTATPPSSTCSRQRWPSSPSSATRRTRPRSCSAPPPCRPTPLRRRENTTPCPTCPRRKVWARWCHVAAGMGTLVLGCCCAGGRAGGSLGGSSRGWRAGRVAQPLLHRLERPRGFSGVEQGSGSRYPPSREASDAFPLLFPFPKAGWGGEVPGRCSCPASEPRAPWRRARRRL